MQQCLIRLPVEIHNRLKAHCDAEDRTMAAVIRRAVRQYLDREETT